MSASPSHNGKLEDFKSLWFWLVVYLLYPPLSMVLIALITPIWLGAEPWIFVPAIFFAQVFVIWTWPIRTTSRKVHRRRGLYTGVPAFLSIVTLVYGLFKPGPIDSMGVFLLVDSIFSQIYLFFWIPQEYDESMDLSQLKRLKDEYQTWVWPMSFIFATFYLPGFIRLLDSSKDPQVALIWLLLGIGFLLAIARVYDHVRAIRVLEEEKQK